MKALVLYDSYFGNTEQIARQIANTLEKKATVIARHVAEATPEELADAVLLVVGSPTRGFRPTPPVTELLNRIPAGSLKGIHVAAFDTRVSLGTIKSGALRFMVKTGGYAAKPISNRLIRKGGIPAAEPMGFLVGGEQGPLLDGELEKASAWASGLL